MSCSRDYAFLGARGRTSGEDEPTAGTATEPDAATGTTSAGAPGDLGGVAQGGASDDAVASGDANATSGGEGGAGASGGEAGASSGGSAPLTGQVAVGGHHLCLIVEQPSYGRIVYCRGDNSSGQLGDGSGRNQPDPEFGWRAVVTAQDLPLVGVEAIGAGEQHTCALLANEVHCWGLNKHKEVDPTVDPTLAEGMVAAATRVDLASPGAPLVVGGYNSCAGTPAYCWGDNRRHQIRSSADAAVGLAPRQLEPTPTVVALGTFHSCMIRDQDTLCWGADDFRQCATPLDRVCDDLGACDSAPVLVPGLSGARGIALGTHHTCAIDRAGGVQCWGSNSNGELGSAPPEGCKMGQSPAPECVLPPTTVAGLTDVRMLALGQAHTCAVAGPSGAAYCWGSNNNGQLGRGSNVTASEVPAPVRTAVRPPSALPPTPLEGVVSLVARGDYTCATTDAGATLCWGRLEALEGEIVQSSSIAVPLSLDGL
jgi:hypothetical protein